MPSIAGFIHSLLSEDMYATGMLEQMDERISQLNAGQLRLLIRFIQNKVPGLTNKTVLDAYTKLLQKATAESDKRHEEEVRGEREKLSQLKAAHAGVNAKAWDTSHACLDRELAKFQKFLKSKARRVAEEEVFQEETEKLHNQLMALPARRAAAESKRHAWWVSGAVLVAVIGPILVLILVPIGVWIAVGAFLITSALAAACWFVGVRRGIVVTPALDDNDIEDKTRKRAKETLKGYREEVRRTFEATENIFAADMKWRDEWAAGRKKERRNERRRAKKALEETTTARGSASCARIFPGSEEEEQGDRSCSSVGHVVPDAGDGSSGRVIPGEVCRMIQEAGEPPLAAVGISGTERFRDEGEGAGAHQSSAPSYSDAVAQSGDNNLRGATLGAVTRCRGCDKAVLARAAPVTEAGPGETHRKSSAPTSVSSEEGRKLVGETSREGTNDTRLLRGPCQGSCLLRKPTQGSEEEQHHLVVPSTAGLSSAIGGGTFQERGSPSLEGATAADRDGIVGAEKAAMCGMAV